MTDKQFDRHFVSTVDDPRTLDEILEDIGTYIKRMTATTEIILANIREIKGMRERGEI